MRGEQLLSIVKNGELVKFNSRPCGRGDHHMPREKPLYRISIHAPAGGATVNINQCSCGNLISIHAPAGGATAAPVYQRQLFSDFNSRTCGRGDRLGAECSFCREISIHAPAGGATVTEYVGDVTTWIFQFTPLREGRPRGSAVFPPESYFNSRPCGRGD